MRKKFFVFTDGGARGNPGPAAAAFIVKDNQGKILAKVAKFIGRTTNNVAEYAAVIEALKWILKNVQMFKYSNVKINFFLDSNLVVNQLNGFFKIKDNKLRDLIIKVRQLERETGGNILYYFIPREKNKDADFLVGQKLKKSIP